MATLQEQIAGLYIAFFNRAPDKAGFDMWVSKDDGSGDIINEIAAGFAEHSVFTSTYADMDDETFVEAIYQNVLGSAGDTAGIANQVRALSDGTYLTRADFIAGFVDSVLSLDLTSDAFSDLSAQELLDAQARQDLLKNKTEASLYYIEKLGDKTNVTDAANPLEDPAYLASIEILSSITAETQTLTAIKNDILLSSLGPNITSIVISDGNYTTDSIVDITLTFSKDIVVSGTDSKLALSIGDYTKYASYASKTSNTITYKYTIEDGISDTEQTIKVQENALVLNTTTIKDTISNDASLSNLQQEDPDATVNDTKAPSITISSAQYISNADQLILNGTGFLSILEQSEDSSAEVLDRFDFTKLIWDIDSDDDTTPNVLFTNTDIKLIKIQNDKEISMVLSPTFTSLESATNYGHGDNTTSIDTLDILSGFVFDNAGNISSDTATNDIVLGIDGTTYGDSKANTIVGTTNADTIDGKDNNDILYGGVGADTLTGSSGDDTLIGGAGIDTLSGGVGADIFVFSTINQDTVVSFGSVEGMDKIIDLSLDGALADRIDLDIQVQNVNASVSGSVSQDTFISDMNTLLKISNDGFNKTIKEDISASIVYVNNADLKDKIYLVVDVNADDSFTSDDFAIDITGVNISNFNIDVFI